MHEENTKATTSCSSWFVVHFVILIGMAAAAFASREAEAFFAAFLWLKLFFDVLFELPEWNPKEPPRWIAWLYSRFGDKKDDINALWAKWRVEQKEGFEEDERTVDPATLPAPPSPQS